MKSIKQIVVLFFVAFLSLSLFVGCTPSKPSNSEVEQIVKSTLQRPEKNIWFSLDNSSWHYVDIKINSLEVMEWGSFNKQEKYWPVKIRIEGNAIKAETIYNREQFNSIIDFKFMKDDYGKWQTYCCNMTQF